MYYPQTAAATVSGAVAATVIVGYCRLTPGYGVMLAAFALRLPGLLAVRVEMVDCNSVGGLGDAEDESRRGGGGGKGG